MHNHAAKYHLSQTLDSQQLHKNLVTHFQGQQICPPLWVDYVPLNSKSKLARQRCHAEMTKPLNNTIFEPLRIVVLIYKDKRMDLIIVANRLHYDQFALDLIAKAIWSEPNLARLERKHPKTHPALAITNKPLPLVFTNINREIMTLAVLIILQNYFEKKLTTAAFFSSENRPDSRMGCYDIFKVLSVISPKETISEHEKTFANTRQSDLCENLDGCDIAILFCHADSLATEYLPFLQFSLPLTLVFDVTYEGKTNLAIYFKKSDNHSHMIAQLELSLIRIYEQMCASPTLIAGNIDLLDSTERNKISALGGLALSLITSNQRIEQAFNARAKRLPKAIALSFENQQLTYQQLDQQSTTLAHALQKIGVQNNDHLGVCLHRSHNLVIILLAVLKIGAVYVPMDPNYPIERLHYIAKDARLKLIITTKTTYFPELSITQISTEQLYQSVDLSLSHSPIPQGDGNSPAYIIYTSGSTGRPKGVVVPHRNVIHLIETTQDELQFSPEDIWTLFHSSSFDFSVWEMWGCLLTGGQLAVVPEWLTKSPSEFFQFLVDKKITVLNQTPSAFGQLIDLDTKQPLSLRLIIFGGETLDTNRLLNWLDSYPETTCRLVNMYGTTETTVHVTLQTISRYHALTHSRVVGRALQGWYIYILDENQQLLPLGAVGEIYIGGAGVALHYLNQPQLTSEKFIADPFAGGIMYKSGDKGRLLSNGCLEHLGRYDSQIKLRGFRIELEEIRAVLLEMPAVKEALVIPRHLDKSDPATAKIEAYVRLNEQGTILDIRNNIKLILPDYMIPSITEIKAFPLTVNGKIDIALLPSPEKPILDNELKLLSNRDYGERLRFLWQKYLRVPVTLDDNFFDSGGNSLIASQIWTTLKTQNFPALSIRALYEHQTIRTLVQFLEENEYDQCY